MKDDNKLKEEDIKKVSGGNGGLIKKDDKDRPGWHCCECGHWYGDVDFSGFNENPRKELCPECGKIARAYYID